MLLINKVENNEITFLSNESFETTDDPVLNNALRAAEAHKNIRYYLQNYIKPGISVRSIIDYVEQATRTMLKGELNNGIGFPCGVSINDCAAHFSLNPWQDDIFIGEKDVVSIDFGTHSDGRIIDSAFTVAFDEKYQKLLESSLDATNSAIKLLGLDIQVCELGKCIEEIITSYELTDEYRNSIPIQPVRNLNGHSIGQYKIHDGLHIPSYDNGDTSRVVNGFVAIETFSSTGNGFIEEEGECSHYMVASSSPSSKIYNQKIKKLFNMIQNNIGTLPFSPQHLLYYDPDFKYYFLNLLSCRHFIDPYPPLFDLPKNTKVAQFEHTIYLNETKKIIVSKGEDF